MFPEEDSPTFTDGMFDDAALYAKLATEQEKMTLAYRHYAHFFLGLRMVNKGLEGWRDRGVVIEEGQKLADFIDFEIDPNFKFDCSKLNCHPNDPTKYHEDDPDKDGACDFYQSHESEVDAGGVKFQTCQGACFNLTKQIDPESGRPLPRGNYFLPHLDKENKCHAINQQLLTFALIPTSRYSQSGRLWGFNSADVPPFSIDSSFSNMNVNYPYCQYFQKKYDHKNCECYYTLSSVVGRFLFGDVLTNWMFLEDTAAINSSLPKITKRNPPASETTPSLNPEEVVEGHRYYVDSITRAQQINGRFVDRMKKNVMSQEDIIETMHDVFALFSELSFFSEAENLQESDLKRIMWQIIKDDETLQRGDKDIMSNFNFLTNTLFVYKQQLIEQTLGGTSSNLREIWRTSVRGEMNSYYSVNPRKNLNAGGANNIKPVMYKVEENPWLNPVKTVAVKIWEDLLSFEQAIRNGPTLGETERKFEFSNNIVATLLASTAIDNSIVMLGKQTKNVAAKLIQPTSNKLLALSSRNFGVKMGGKIIGKAIVAQVTKKMANVVAKIILKVAVQMLKLLAKLATAVFSVVAFVLTAFSILGFILDLTLDYSWAEQYTTADNLKQYSQAFRDSFRDKMNIRSKDMVTAPFSVKDLLAYVADAKMGGTETFGIVHGEMIEDVFNQKSMCEATEDALFYKHYYKYLSTRTVNTFGQPIVNTQTPNLEEYDTEKEIEKIRYDLYEIAAKGTVYADVIAYNASRLPLKDIANYEEKYITDAVTDQNIKLNITINKIMILVHATASLVVFFLLMSVIGNSHLSILCGMISFFLFVCTLIVLLLIIKKIETNYIRFICSTKLFKIEDMSPSLFAEKKGAAKYEELVSNVTNFTVSYMKPYNESLKNDFPPSV